MDNLPVEHHISNLVQYQFPTFYNEHGPVFIQFVKAYYEWLEDTGNPLYYNRRLLETFDIDLTLDEFLEHFQRKYLYGIPFDVIINKRSLIKHVLDAYRSKGSVQCFKLLFRLIYNENVEVYLPGNDMLRPSDATWVHPMYIESSDSEYLSDMIGKKIQGVTSGTSAVVEGVVKMPSRGSIINMVFITNVNPRNGDFTVGERFVVADLLGKTDFETLINASPTIIGSMDTIEIINGGQGFSVGDQLTIPRYDVETGNLITNGLGGAVSVRAVGAANGQLNFVITNYGFGVTNTANIFIYANTSDTITSNASFSVGSLASPQSIQYNTDVIASMESTLIDAAAYGFAGNSAANATANTIGGALSFTNATFGSLSTLTNLNTGVGYTRSPSIFIHNSLLSNALSGSVSYNRTSANITGTSTTFTNYFANNDTIVIQANTSLANTIEYHVIQQVVNNTVIVLYDMPAANSTASATHKVAPIIFPANFTSDSPYMQNNDGTLNGNNSIVVGQPSSGSGVISVAEAVDSGRGYEEGKLVELYPADALQIPTIVAAGNNYINGDIITVTGGDPYQTATGTVLTNANGNVTSLLWSGGAGYKSLPTLTINSRAGSGANLSTTILAFDTSVTVTGLIRKAGIGVRRGYWSTTRSFLSSDKYIQDSYFYQEFSYQLKAAVVLDKYREILYKTFHPTGTEMFGAYLKSQVVGDSASVLYSNTTPIIS